MTQIGKLLQQFIVSLIFSLVMFIACSSVALAAPETSGGEESDISAQAVQPRLYWNGSANLNGYSWTDLVSDNNLIWANLKVTSDAGNIGVVYIRVVDEYGEEIISQRRLYPDDSIDLPSISAMSSYTVQAKCVSNATAGRYYFTVTDITLPPREASVQPRLYWKGSVFVTSDWTDVVPDNNLIWANLRVTSSKYNEGDVYIRVIDKDGNEIVEETLVSPDNQIYLPSIPAFSSYIVQAKCASGSPSGFYLFTVTDVTFPSNEA